MEKITVSLIKYSGCKKGVVLEKLEAEAETQYSNNSVFYLTHLEKDTAFRYLISKATEKQLEKTASMSFSASQYSHYLIMV